MSEFRQTTVNKASEQIGQSCSKRLIVSNIWFCSFLRFFLKLSWSFPEAFLKFIRKLFWSFFAERFRGALESNEPEVQEQYRILVFWASFKLRSSTNGQRGSQIVLRDKFLVEKKPKFVKPHELGSGSLPNPVRSEIANWELHYGARFYRKKTTKVNRRPPMNVEWLESTK